jgi:hypothetical protein
MKKIDNLTIWKKYEAGLKFNTDIHLLENVETNENYYIGKQWEGVKSNGLPTPVFNMLKQIVQHQVASITSDNIKMNASPLAASANDSEMEKLTRIVNDEFAALFERNRVTTLLREYARNAAVDGDSCLFSYWDEDTVVTEILENTRVFFGNPNDKNVQNQPYIIIARRDMLDEVKEFAEEHGCKELDKIKADSDDNQSKMDAMVDDKVTRLLYLWKDKKTGSVHGIESVKGTIIRPEWDLMIRRYPITWLNWDYVQDCYHGQALITGLIPNQQFVNKAYAMAMVSLMMSAFPKIVYDRNRVTRWTNQVGAQIGVNGDITGIAQVLEPAQISPQVAQFISSAIEHTQSFTGATAAALGNTRPDNTSAIIALQRAASIPSEITKQNLYQSVEDLGRIYVEFMAFYYGTRTVDVPAEAVMPADMLQFAMVPQNQKMQTEFDFSALQDIPMFLKLDVGASAYWSEIASMQTLDNLLQLGQIDIVDYLERIPDGYISKREELLAKYKQRLAPQTPDVGNVEGDIADTGQEIPVEGGAGNRQLQRAVASTM